MDAMTQEFATKDLSKIAQVYGAIEVAGGIFPLITRRTGYDPGIRLPISA